MLQIDGYNIGIPSGDTLSMRVQFAGASVPAGTQVLFTVRLNPGDQQGILERTYIVDGDGGILIYLIGSETRLPPGTYAWDLRLIWPIEGAPARIITPFVPAKFKVLEVVGRVEGG